MGFRSQQQQQQQNGSYIALNTEVPKRFNKQTEKNKKQKVLES